MLRDVVDKLKPRYKELVKMRYYEELSYEEIGIKLDLPIGTVKAQLFRAREFLYNILKNQENKLQHFTALFRVLSPANTLKRGFAIVIKDGVIQTDARQIKKDDSIQVYLGESELDVSVIQKQKKDGRN